MVAPTPTCSVILLPLRTPVNSLWPVGTPLLPTPRGLPSFSAWPEYPVRGQLSVLDGEAAQGHARPLGGLCVGASAGAL